MKTAIQYRFCGGRWSHSEHWIHVGANPLLFRGAADYYCIGYVPAEMRSDV